MAVDDVKFGRQPRNNFEQNGIGNVKIRVATRAKRMGTRRDQGGARDRITRGEERDRMTERNELLGQPRYDLLGAAIELWGDALGERCDLGDAKGALPLLRPERYVDSTHLRHATRKRLASRERLIPASRRRRKGTIRHGCSRICLDRHTTAAPGQW